MRNLFCLLMAASVSACASFNADAGKFSVGGVSGDPQGMTRTLGEVHRKQYASETSRFYVQEAMKRGRPVSPTVIDSLQTNGNGYGAYPGYASGGESWFYGYNAPSVLNGTYMPSDSVPTVVDGQPNTAGYATQEQMAETDRRSRAALKAVKAMVRNRAADENAEQK